MLKLETIKKYYVQIIFFILIISILFYLIYTHFLKETSNKIEYFQAEHLEEQKIQI